MARTKTEKETDEKTDEVGLYSIEDPILLNNMVLTKNVRHPRTGVNLLTKGNLLTTKSIDQLKNVQVKTVYAMPYAEEIMDDAVEKIQNYFQSVDKIIETKGISLNDAAALFRDMEVAKELRQVVDNQMRNVLRYFNENAADALIKLNNHHPDSAHHSIISGFNAMAIAKALGWSEEEILETTMATMTHDLGKVKVPLDTLAWPGGLNDKQWKETQLHPLFGGTLLNQGTLTHTGMVAMNHHEWFSSLTGRGYGSLTKFRESTKTDLGLDVDEYLSQATPRQVEMTQICAMADMVTALEEVRSYKGALPPIKVLIIMNDDAKKGHFNPAHYRAWHAMYTRKHSRLLPKNLRISLPREMEVNIQRNNKKFISLEAKIRKLSFDELEQMDLLLRLKHLAFDLDIIKKNNGISLERIEKRGNLKINVKKMEDLGINPEKRVTVLLPADEIRLGLSDMRALGVDEDKLHKKMFLHLLGQSQGSLSVQELNKAGIQFSREQLASVEGSLKKKIFYDLLVTEELGPCNALFAIVREGDRLEDLGKANTLDTLDPLRSYLLNQIGIVELNLSALTTTLPDMSGVVRGEHWNPHTAVTAA